MIDKPFKNLIRRVIVLNNKTMDNKINFNDLPGDIKSMIYKANKESERDEAYNNKNKYNEVLTELSEIVEDNDIDSITPSLIWEINFDDRYELYQEEALDRYYELDFI
jgi:hypothetical protein